MGSRQTDGYARLHRPGLLCTQNITSPLVAFSNSYKKSTDVSYPLLTGPPIPETEMPSSNLSRLLFSTRATSNILAYHLQTLWLFSSSDIKTIMVPVTCFALGTAPLSPTNSLSHAVHAIIWVYLHLLHFNVANQVHDPEEDRLNKPWRPIPAGRLTMSQATFIRYLVAVVCMVVSLFYSAAVFYASATFAILVPAYHELGGDSHWFVRNLLNASGYACFTTGSTLIASQNRTRLDFPGALSIVIITAILATTIQAQDFRDVIGDKVTGRCTLPIAFPRLSRYTPMISLCLWSFCLNHIWELDDTVATAFTLLSIITGLRYFLLRTTKDDRLSYTFYNIWLAVALSTPGYWRFYRESAAL